MHLRLESFSTEVFFEIFEYLSSVDLFRGFFGLNGCLQRILNMYPLRLNLQQICRSDLDFLCHHIQPKQIISILLSEETMPDQVNIFLKYFPNFEHQFICLQSVNFIKTENCISKLPQCVSSLSFEKCLGQLWLENKIGDILIHQAKVLTHLNIQDERLIESINIELPLLKQLIIDSPCLIDRLHQIIQCLKASIISLKVSIRNQKDYYFPSKFEKLCQSLMYLKHLNITFASGIEISFHLLEQSLNHLPRLTHLTIEATGTLDLLDGVRWEEFLRRRGLIKFYFKFSLSLNLVWNQDQYSLLEPFRSSFWLKEKHWYVACYKNEWGNKCPLIFSVPYIVPHSIAYLNEIYPPLSTASSNVEKQLFYDTNINHLECYFSRLDSRQTYIFTKVKSLRLINRCSPFNLNMLTSTVDLGRVRILDISSVDHISTSELRDLLEHTPCLYHLTMRQQNQSLILPSHIRSLHLKRSLSQDSINFTNIDELRCELLHVVQLEIKVQTQELMIEIIERFDQLESIIFQWSGYLSEKYTSSEWFQQNTRRLHENNFTCRRGSERERGEPRQQIGCGYVPPKVFIYLSISKHDPKRPALDKDRSSLHSLLTIFQRGWNNLFHRN
ncbi:unnamed protein product [Rotaria magnacalcarata]